MNILLVCSYFGPETSVGVNRVNAFTRFWLAAGCSLDIITMPYSDPLPECLQNQDNLTIHQVRPFFCGNKKRVFPASGTIKPSQFKSRIKNVFHWLKKTVFANYLDPRSLWWPKAATLANAICKQKKIDFIFTSVPSYTAHSIGAVVKFFNPSVYWVADYRDLWSGNPVFPGMALFRWLERHHEAFILTQADLLVTINDDLALTLKRLHPQKKILVISNGFDPSLLKIQATITQTVKQRLTIVYTGTVLYGYQNPEPLFQAMAHLIQKKAIPESAIELIFYGDVGAIKPSAEFKFLLDKGIIQLKGRVSREISLKAQREADLLLFLGAKAQKGGDGVKGVVTGKIYEYLVSGTEILALGVTEDMVVGEMILKSHAGELYGEDLTKIEGRLLKLYQEGGVKMERNQSYLAQFNQEIQADRLLGEIKKFAFEK